ncbi:hypothetical protein [Shewanella sp. S1-58-MNA-CIBAN-0166]|uniref:hypothetical protein n=1 Tax=Shewanella sp. S1-58-MNA-CIBAN-0166 TaxID=3140467 RepID=UPI003325CCB1
MLSPNAVLENCLPFIIGVTGHRDIYNSTILDPPYKNDIRQALLYWREVVGSNTPIWLMTGLATGADLLATEVALEIQQAGELGAFKIIGCLPMPLEHYLSDFYGLNYAPDAAEQLNTIVAALDSNNNELIEVRHNLSEENYQIAINDPAYGALRNSLYLNQGLFISKYSNVLLSLWDGKPSLGVGGTADIVIYKLGAEVIWPIGTENPALQPTSDFDGQTSGLVHHISVDRMTQNENPNVDVDVAYEFIEYTEGKPAPVGKLYSSLRKIEQNDSYLQDFLSKEFVKLVAELAVHNSKASQHSVVEEADGNIGLQGTKSIFKTADALALAAQTEYRKFLLMFFLLAIPGYALYEIAGNWVNSDIGLSIFTLIFVVILSCWWVINQTAKKDMKWNYQLARGVAEAMRIRGFLNMADIEPSSTTLIPRRFRLHLPLLNHAIGIAELDWWRYKISFQREDIEQTWLRDQLSFLSLRLQQSECSFKELIYKRPRHAASMANRYSKGFFYCSIGIGVVLLVLMSLQLTLQITIFTQLNEWLMLLLQYSLMIAGLILLWSELAGYEMTAKGYESLEDLYRRALVLLEGQLTPSKKQMLLDLAREAMFEHVSWTSSETKNDLKQKQ